MLREIKFSNERGPGPAVVKLGLFRPAVLRRGQTLKVEITEAEEVALLADRCYTLTTPAPPKKEPEPVTAPVRRRIKPTNRPRGNE